MNVPVDLEAYVQAYLAIDNVEDSNVPSNLALDVVGRKTTLLTLVKGLGPTLVAEDDKQRGRGALLPLLSFVA